MSNIDINDTVAHIKSEFVLPQEPHVPKQNTSENEDSSSSEPPKKKQFTGTNRKRPPLIKDPRSSKLCMSVWCLKEGEDETDKCKKERCPFSHNIDQYLQSKSEDFDEKCHNYRTFGMCQYGITCRYSKDHVENKTNIVNEELWAKNEDKPLVLNTLKKEIQYNLRKHNYDFTKAIDAHKIAQLDVEKRVHERQGHDKGYRGETNFLGPAADDDIIKLNAREKKKINWHGKTYLAPLTTLGNLPFRRICKDYGADITCGEMALAANLLQGSMSEWALVKRHPSEDIFGVQICGGNAEVVIKCAQLLETETEIDFIDINLGCPIDLIYKQGGGSALLRRQGCLERMVKGMTSILSIPLTLKMRTAVYHGTNVAHNFIEKAKLWDVSMVTLHGRSREQRYLKLADWDYIKECTSLADPMPLFGNGDVMSYEDYDHHMENSKVAGIMMGRGALIKPWIFKEIKEKKHYDISSTERLDMLRKYTHYGMEHWGSDSEGIEKTRRFLLEWLSFLNRYIPVGILDQTQRINQRPPPFKGRDELETLMASRSVNDWVKISEMLLGPTPSNFNFLPKHRASAY